MSSLVICPSCQEQNPGSLLRCQKCETSLIGVERWMLQPSGQELAAQTQENLNQKVVLVEEKVRTQSLLKGSASNFYWIAALSLINSFTVQTGMQFSFTIGLAATQWIDYFSLAFMQEIGGTIATVIRVVAFLLDLSLAGLFVIFGIYASKQHKWAFLVGMALYALDGLLFVFLQDWLAAGFHLFILYGLFNGYRSIQRFDTVQQKINA